MLFSPYHQNKFFLNFPLLTTTSTTLTTTITTTTTTTITATTTIFIDMIAPEKPRVFHKLTYFSSGDPRDTHGYLAE